MKGKEAIDVLTGYVFSKKTGLGKDELAEAILWAVKELKQRKTISNKMLRKLLNGLYQDAHANVEFDEIVANATIDIAMKSIQKEGSFDKCEVVMGDIIGLLDTFTYKGISGFDKLIWREETRKAIASALTEKFIVLRRERKP